MFAFSINQRLFVGFWVLRVRFDTSEVWVMVVVSIVTQGQISLRLLLFCPVISHRAIAAYQIPRHRTMLNGPIRGDIATQTLSCTSRE